MRAEEIMAYCLGKHCAYETRPFGEIPICYRLQGKIFAQLYPYDRDFKITLKCAADTGDLYRQLFPGRVVRGYHCPPVQQPYWNTIYLKDFPGDVLRRMIDHAYETVLRSFSRKIQGEIMAEK